MCWRGSDGKLRLKPGGSGPGTGAEMAAKDSPAIPALLPVSPAALPPEQTEREDKNIPHHLPQPLGRLLINVFSSPGVSELAAAPGRAFPGLTAESCSWDPHQLLPLPMGLLDSL